MQNTTLIRPLFSCAAASEAGFPAMPSRRSTRSLKDVGRAETRPHQGEPLAWLLLHRERHPLRVVLTNDHVHRTLLLADLQVLPGGLRKRFPGALQASLCYDGLV
jgi:hypothetical protein